jgi:hypothetical protein
MLDFYLIVSTYREAFCRHWLALANHLLPPNVFRFSHEGRVAKVAVLSEADFARLNSPAAPDASLWARFAQPSRLVWVKDDAARMQIVDAVAQAAPALFAHAKPMANGEDMLDVWRRGLELTYSCELRPERPGRARSLVDHDPERYRRFTEALGPTVREIADAPRVWRRFRRRGKALTIVRLLKATMTYGADIDYLAWKIGRHAGVAVELKPWHRRWPLIGALTLLPRLLRQGVVR